MAGITPPNWGKIGEQFADAMRQFSAQLTAAGAVGSMLRSDFKAARKTLELVDADTLRAISAAALAVSSLADEVLATREDTE
jgi:hypothetical protein